MWMVGSDDERPVRGKVGNRLFGEVELDVQNTNEAFEKIIIAGRLRLRIQSAQLVQSKQLREKRP